jgi:hypothetical protein
MSDEQHSANPRVFISYSWTSEDHSEWVADLGERLMNDGIDVVLDQWSLEDGHDVNAFMERMVTDPTINRVIIVSDALYAAKADGCKGGVGTETQIISKEVYDSVDQNKFVPLVRERDGDGNACLPIFLKSRKYIDFSDLDHEAEAYDQLVRNIFERPRRRKPAIGKAPSHLFDDDATIVTSAQKAKRFRELVTTGKGNPSAAFEDFAEEFLVNFEDLRMKYSKEGAGTWCDRIRANIQSATAHRDAFVDAIRTGAAHLPSQQFMPLLLGLLERLLPFQERPESSGAFYSCSEDNYKLLCYELFLYTFAAFIKAKKHPESRQLLDYHYVAPRTLGGSDVRGCSFTGFNRYAESLEDLCAAQGDRKRLSVMADLVHDRAARKDLHFSDVLQADLLLCIASRGHGWYPRCLIYSQSAGKLELFVRAVNEDGFAPLGQVLKLNNPQELFQLLSSEQLQKLWHSERLGHADITMECLNYDELERRWGEKSSL